MLRPVRPGAIILHIFSRCEIYARCPRCRALTFDSERDRSPAKAAPSRGRASQRQGKGRKTSNGA